MKKIKELQVYAKQARLAGYVVQRSANAGGWIKLAKACGFVDGGKAAATTYLRSKFGLGSPSHPITATPEKIAEVQRQTRRYNNPTHIRGINVASDDFLQTYEWRRVRMEALKKYGRICQCCGASPATGAVMNVDHIKPRRIFPQLALDLDNLQVLCHECNHGKGNWDMTDWRPDELTDADRENMAHLKSI